MIKRFIKVPEPITAVQWVNNNEEEIKNFIGQERVSFVPSIYNSSIDVYIDDAYGKEMAEVGDYIVKYNNGDIFIWGRGAFEKYFREVE